MSIINVTKSFLPPIEEYNKYIEELWKSGWLTNNGPYVQELEAKLKEYLGVKHLIFLSNGTVAIQIALQALEIQGDVITTPFSYVATTSSLVWEKCKPVFADINSKTFCLDPLEVRKKINKNTKAILATHVFGNGCDVEAFDTISKEYNIPVIYDAAHAFGVKYKNQSILNFGDVSTLSFHATKLFHTIEGGALVTNDDALAHKMEYMRRFGHDGPSNFQGIGINGKNSEFHAAMGLCVFPYLNTIISKRKNIVDLYIKNLSQLGEKISFLEIKPNTEWNYAYFPIVFQSEKALLECSEELKKQDILVRRYFNPSLNTLSYIEDSQTMPISESIAERIICLPLYPELELLDVERICNTIIHSLQKK